MHALILADGDPPSRAGLDAAWPDWDRDASLVIAADGGARHAHVLDLDIDLWVGDGDSVDAADIDRLAAAGTRLQTAATDKDETDCELAIQAALARGATRLTILGALGGRRTDHGLANVSLLAFDGVVGRDVRLLSDTARVRLILAPDAEGGPIRIILAGRAGDVVSLLPWGGDAIGVTTSGLHYPLHDEGLTVGRTRGLSNIRTADHASVTLRAGALVIVESPASL